VGLRIEQTRPEKSTVQEPNTTTPSCERIISTATTNTRNVANTTLVAGSKFGNTDPATSNGNAARQSSVNTAV
jgi:hypothetical protein